MSGAMLCPSLLGRDVGCVCLGALVVVVAIAHASDLHIFVPNSAEKCVCRPSVFFLQRQDVSFSIAVCTRIQPTDYRSAVDLFKIQWFLCFPFNWFSHGLVSQVPRSGNENIQTHDACCRLSFQMISVSVYAVLYLMLTIFSSQNAHVGMLNSCVCTQELHRVIF